MNIVPPLGDLRSIDPQGAGMDAYNRYGYMLLVPGQGPGVTFTPVHTTGRPTLSWRDETSSDARGAATTDGHYRVDG
jgi:hypothetical protein